MKAHIFSIWDKKVQAFIGSPFFCPTAGAALRMFADLARDTNSDIGKHPEDYSLSHIGTFDHFTGEVTPADAKAGAIHLVEALNFMER